MLKIARIIVKLCTSADQTRVSPQLALGVEGDDLHLKCRSYSTAVWSYNDGAIPINAKYENYFNLVIKNIIKTNEGTYECLGVTETKERFRGSISVIITSEYKPKLLDNCYLPDDIRQIYGNHVNIFLRRKVYVACRKRV